MHMLDVLGQVRNFPSAPSFARGRCLPVPCPAATARPNLFAANLPASPGSHVDPGETSRDAAARELAEETGVHVTPEALHQLGTWDQFGRDPHGRYVTVAYRVTVPTGTPKTSAKGTFRPIVAEQPSLAVIDPGGPADRRQAHTSPAVLG